MTSSKYSFSLLIITLLPLFLMGFGLNTGLVSGFVAIPDNDRIYVRWLSLNESSVIRYELLRQEDGNLPISITEISPMGNNRNYEYIDMSVSNRNLPPNQQPIALSQSRYTYILKMITTSGTLEVRTTVSYQTSTTRRTWGSIKALFR